MSTVKNAVKGGKFYHVYNYGTPSERWEYVRPASTADASGGAAAPAPPPPPVPGVVAPLIPQAPPPPTPFFSADDLMSQNNFWTQWNQTFSDLDAALAKLRTDTQYQQQQLDQSHVDSRSANDWNAAARGLQHSSVKDGTTAKIEADYARGTNQLKDNLNNAAIDTANRKNYFNTVALPQFNAAMNQKAVENAMAASYNAPPPPPPGGAAAGAPGSAPAPAIPQGMTKTAPSAAHGGALWVYVQNTNGSWRPLRPANGFGH